MEVQLQKFANLTVPFSLEGISFLGTVRVFSFKCINMVSLFFNDVRCDLK